ncbi:uncharacterized protein Eint_020570 [Encephalitozoon intestinalis ATCC 50506]|uniref:Uncharacterized protein n=1 Tax=Encephalitozoon intestinalis (strain ATCC 50506) TaxID=876142 RepID=E0S5S1_ENCIT|nr:uncharacterized protein Eint_020570 [Encephalitozoon intestinalis ATCC 50506]ADM11056.1 hypothetical protein Eint_020570 [Encephalitozoon intestinalis ATCC 50506]UTX44706.1 hypothetical protein GPK93_02g02230 [Encephalitozoon intestinalis]
MHFLVKKPGWLVFDPNEYGDEEVRTFQVRHKESCSNTKLVKFEDGSWYLKNGSQMFSLKPVASKREVGVGAKDGNVVYIREILDKKWFIKMDKSSER